MAFDLASVLKDVSNPDTGREQIEYIRLDLIDSDANNFYQLSDLEGLADNIALCGLQQPIRVRRSAENPERFTIVSGHRRRAAIELLAKEDPDKWQEAACIVERDAVSPALQQLRLIYANASTRKLTPAEISEQAVQVEKLLYQLKEEEGYEFPGRMRDHVAQAVGQSRTKLARLKVIRENLAKCWLPLWNKNFLSESTAYELAKLSDDIQQLIFDTRKSDDDRRYIHASSIELYAERIMIIEKLKCTKNKGHPCENCERKKKKALEIDRWTYFHCSSCCGDCSLLASCRHACPKLSDKVKKLRAKNKERRQADKAAQEKRDKPTIDFIQEVYSRIGKAREMSKVSVKALFDAQSRWHSIKDMEELEGLENGTVKATTSTNLPFGYSFSVCYAEKLVKVADALNCSIDYMLCRTDYPELVKEAPSDKVSNSGTVWNTGTPDCNGRYVVMVRFSPGKEGTPQKLDWNGEDWTIFGESVGIESSQILGWIPMPQEAESK